MFERIINVEEIGEQQVYDISIDSEFHNFYANDIVVHNCYAYIAWQCLYFKTYYPSYFYAAMINQAGDIEKIKEIISDAKVHNIEILPQSILKSSYKTKAEGGAIRLGFGMLKGFGESTQIDFDNLPKETEKILSYKFKKVNQTQFKTLIDLGCYDELGYDREYILQLKEIYEDEKIEQWFTRKKQPLRIETCPKSLLKFATAEVCLSIAMKAKNEDDYTTALINGVIALNKNTKSSVNYEKETKKKQLEILGFSLSEVDMSSFETSFKFKGILPITELEDESKRYYFSIEQAEVALTKTGKKYMKLTLNNNIKCKCWKEIPNLEIGTIYSAKFKKDTYGITMESNSINKEI